MTLQVTTALSAQCVLGEGLHWDARRNLLWFVDIHGPRVHWFDPDSLRSGSRVVPEPVGWALTIEDSEYMLLGLRSGLALLDVLDPSSDIRWLDRSFPDADQRLNDAKVDPSGRLWYGSVSISDQTLPVGRLARHNLDGGGPVVMDSGYLVPNGPAFGSDGRVMLHNDSARRVTYRFDVDAVSKLAVRRSVWRQYDEQEGYPDGMNFDADGCVWIAHWGAGKVCRYDMQARRLLEIPVPARNVTNVCFAGRDLDRLFVTSARDESAGEFREDPGGALFEIAGLEIKGLPPGRLRLRSHPDLRTGTR